MELPDNRKEVIREVINAAEVLRRIFPPAFLVGAWSTVSYSRKMLEAAAKETVAREDPGAADKPLEESLAAAPFMLRISGLTPLADRIRTASDEGRFDEEELLGIFDEALEQFTKSLDLVVGEGCIGHYFIGALSVLSAYEEQVGNVLFAIKGERPADERRAALIDSVSEEILASFSSGVPVKLVSGLENELADLRKSMESCYNAYQELKGK
ncbi:MAG: hypothetical protein IJ071_11940 [Ruminococcus sp.]|nr:hypothetical protein [Ruminococcus sp.]